MEHLGGETDNRGRVLQKYMAYPASLIIMEVLPKGSWKMCLVSKWTIFHFHDYGRKGSPYILVKILGP